MIAKKEQLAAQRCMECLNSTRQRLGWTQEELAARLGIAGNTLSRYERGLTKIQHALWLMAILEKIESEEL